MRICTTKDTDKGLNATEESTIAILTAKVRWRRIEFGDGFCDGMEVWEREIFVIFWIVP